MLSFFQKNDSIHYFLIVFRDQDIRGAEVPANRYVERDRITDIAHVRVLQFNLKVVPVIRPWRELDLQLNPAYGAIKLNLASALGFEILSGNRRNEFTDSHRGALSERIDAIGRSTQREFTNDLHILLVPKHILHVKLREWDQECPLVHCRLFYGPADLVHPRLDS